MNTKKILIGACVAATVLGSVASLVLADNNQGNDDKFSKAMRGEHEGPEMIVQVGPNGKATLRGTIKTVGSTSLTVTSWGGDWMINIPAGTNVMPVTDLTKFTVGDFVGVQGSVNQSAPWTIDAKIVRDWNLKQLQETNRQEVKQIMQEGMPKNWQGTVSSVSTSSFSLTIDGTAYTVNLAANAKIVDQRYSTISLANIKNGDTVRVFGTLSGTTLTVLVVRDTSIGGQ